MIMKLSTILAELERIAPTSMAESWDNVGLITGDPDQDIKRALLTIDYTSQVAEERASADCDLVIAYHPPLFHAVKKLTAGSLIFDAIRRGVAIYSPHTALDVADGGTNDVLCDIMGATKRGPLKPAVSAVSQYKLVTFVPPDALEAVSDRLFAAGAGRIGNYECCSFRARGTGTFFGNDNAQPAVGRSGRLEQADEIRVETLVPLKRVDEVIAALRSAHPYEEPAFDLVSLAAPPTTDGMGRVADLEHPIGRQELIEKIKAALGLSHVLIAGPTTGIAKRVAACAGACGDLLDNAIEQKADVYLTGEMRHHDALKAAIAGLTVICTLHSNSERVTLKGLQERLTASLPSLPILLSAADRDPFSVR